MGRDGFNPRFLIVTTFANADRSPSAVFAFLAASNVHHCALLPHYQIKLPMAKTVSGALQAEAAAERWRVLKTVGIERLRFEAGITSRADFEHQFFAPRIGEPQSADSRAEIKRRQAAQDMPVPAFA